MYTCVVCTNLESPDLSAWRLQMLQLFWLSPISLFANVRVNTWKGRIQGGQRK